jgi:hypothetical protein
MQINAACLFGNDIANRSDEYFEVESEATGTRLGIVAVSPVS